VVQQAAAAHAAAAAACCTTASIPLSGPVMHRMLLVKNFFFKLSRLFTLLYKISFFLSQEKFSKKI
jgi:hypothetical protein